MPELPEVETVRRTLAPAIGKRIDRIWDSGKGLHMGRKPPRQRLRSLVGATLRNIRRRGKYLLLDTDTPQSLLVHLGMTGRLVLAPAGAARAKHTHLVMQLGDHSELRYVDARRFGVLNVVDRQSEGQALAGLGPDPLVDGVEAKHLYAASRNKRTTLKALLLDQSVIAGLGNIYVSEALWRAKLRPTKHASQLRIANARVLAAAIREVLRNALEKGGTSLRDFVNAEGAKGENADCLWVYGRAGQSCPRCKTTIRRQVLAGRATYFCPRCQR